MKIDIGDVFVSDTDAYMVVNNDVNYELIRLSDGYAVTSADQIEEEIEDLNYYIERCNAKKATLQDAANVLKDK